MKSATILTILALGAATVVATAANDDVSPELARKAAYVWLMKFHPETAEQGYEVRISEPKVYYSYDRERKYYVVYAYFGPGKMPSWKEMERKTKKDRTAYLGPTDSFRSWVIPTSMSELPRSIGRVGIPGTLSFRPTAKYILDGQLPSDTWEYSRTIIEGREMFCVFRSGNKEVVVATNGEILSGDTVYGKPRPPDPAEYLRRIQELWSEVEGAVIDDNLAEPPR